MIGICGKLVTNLCFNLPIRKPLGITMPASILAPRFVVAHVADV
jgi:hypothetical protein